MFALLLLSVAVLAEFRIPFTQTKTHQKILENAMQKYSSKLNLSTCDKGYCMMASEDISFQESLISVPISFALNGLDKTALDIPGQVGLNRLLLNLVYYKFMSKDLSLTNAAVHSFPVEFHVPSNWTSEDFDYYNSLSFFQYEIRIPFNSTDFCIFVNTELDSQRSTLPSAIFECETWSWAFMVAGTRSYQISQDILKELGYYMDLRLKDGGGIDFIFPIIDMFNHKGRQKSDRQAGFLSYSKNPATVHFNSLDDYEKGTEVVSKYGVLNSFNLMTRYGFVLQNNVDDGIEIGLPDTNMCRGTQLRQECIYYLYVYKLDAKYLTSLTDAKTNGEPSQRLLGFINDLVYKSKIEGIDEGEAEILQFALYNYRNDLVEYYETHDALPLRSLRREHSSPGGLQKVNDL